MEVFAAAPPCPSVFELAAAEVAAMCVGRGAAARSAAAAAVARSRPVTGSAVEPPASTPDAHHRSRIRVRGARSGGRMRRPLASPCHVGSTDAAPSRAGLSPDPSSHRIRPTMAGSARVGRRSAAGCAASSPPTRRQPSPPRLQPCRIGSADVAPAAARQWRWRSTSRR
ncbi:serine/arginine-rich splicing factor SR45-like [Oryza glaberrima]|uniref:serine/arginine-rich splicing factor SR45-like n=1 Tax=Oryza glaberrima TaxID=4538 RepID=UPI00224C4CE3|nr:serine/arginine-rich splicing factor SR45-like [Oryza glaberrima]